MSRDDLSIWMWSEACRLLERADTVQRQFVGVVGDAPVAVWEPPADVYETDRELPIEIAQRKTEPERQRQRGCCLPSVLEKVRLPELVGVEDIAADGLSDASGLPAKSPSG